MKKYIYILSLLLISCQEEITLDLTQSEEKIVVEGSIENGFPPYVILTKSQGYFEGIDSETYNNLFVNDVDSIKIWYFNGEEKVSITLEQIIGLNSLPPIYTDLSYFENPENYEFSKEGRTYFLEINWNNQIISSSTTIPEVTPLDCLWVEKSENAEDKFKYDIRALYSDPGDQNNNILVKSKRIQHYEKKDSLECQVNNIPDFSLKLIDAGADVLINGQTFETYFPRPRNSGFPTGKYNGYHMKKCKGDSIEFLQDVVLIKYCQIDEPSLKFWRGLIRQVGTNGNPFAEPMNLVSNINNGFGVFTGYGSAYYKVNIIENTVIKDQYTTSEGLNILDIF